MPAVSAVLGLPQEVRDELNARLVANGFSDYVALADWLQSQGWSIRKSSLGRYSKDLKSDFEEAMADVQRTTALARAWAKSDDDEQGDLLDATARMLQDALLRITIAMRKAEAQAEESDPAEAAKTLSQVTRALADLGRMSIGQKNWALEVKGRLSAKMADLESEAKGGNGRLDPETLRRVREEIYGLV